jgi:hypothetical protein
MITSPGFLIFLSDLECHALGWLVCIRPSVCMLEGFVDCV